MKRALCIFSLFFIFIPSSWAFISSKNFSSSQYEQIIVGFKDEVSNKQIIEFVKENNCKLIGPVDEFKVYTLILPQGVSYKDIAQRFLKDKRVRYVLPSYEMQLQEESLASNIIDKVRDKDKKFFEQIGFFSALKWIEELKKENLLSGENKVILAFIDTGIHPELLEELEREGLVKRGISIMWDKDNKNYKISKNINDVVDLEDGHGTAIATLLSAVGKGVELMPIKYDHTFGTFIEGVKSAIREAKKENKRLIINISASLTVASLVETNVKSALINFYMGEELKKLRQEVNDEESFEDREEILSSLKSEASEKANKIAETILFLYIFLVNRPGGFPDFPDWGEDEFNRIKESMDLTDKEIEVVKYGVNSGIQEFILFTKSPILNDIKKFAQDALIITGAGNNNDSYKNFPAFSKDVISVGAISNDEKASYSCYGDWVDVYAPGGDVVDAMWTLGISNKKLKDFYTMGTSLAAPMISDIASLIFMEEPKLSSQEVRDIIKISSDKIFSQKINQYLGKVDALTSVKVATVYGGIKDEIKCLKEYFNKIENLKNKNLDPAEELLYKRQYQQFLSKEFNQALEKIFKANPDLLKQEKFSLLLNNIFLGEYNYKEAKRDFLLTLWNINSKNINLATGLSISNQNDKDLVKEAVKSKVDGLSEEEVNQILNYEDSNVFNSVRLAKQYKYINELFKILPQVSKGEISEDGFLKHVKNIFVEDEELYRETKDSFKDIFDKLKNNEIDTNKAQKDLLINIWKIGEKYKEEILSNSALVKIDCLNLEESLREILKLKETQLDDEEINSIIDNGNNAKQILKIANSYAGIKDIFEAIDNFKSPWPKDWTSPLDFISFSNVKNLEQWSQFLDQLIENANYMSDGDISDITEKLYTRIVSDFVKIFSNQETISSNISEITNNNPLHRILWKIITNEIDNDQAKSEIVNLIKEESELDEVDIAVNLVENYYGINEKEENLDKIKLDFSNPVDYYPINDPIDKELPVFMW
jgi:hypothetical protein